ARAAAGRVEDREIDVRAAVPRRGDDEIAGRGLGACGFVLGDGTGDGGALRVLQAGQPAIRGPRTALRALARDRACHGVGVVRTELRGGDAERARLGLAEALEA